MQEQYWKTKVKQSKIPRVPWVKILGKPLTAFLFLQFENGADKHYAFKLLHDKIDYYFARYGEMNLKFSRDKVLENAKISVSARYTEYMRKVNR